MTHPLPNPIVTTLIDGKVALDPTAVQSNFDDISFNLGNNDPLPTFTVATLPSPGAVGAGVQVFVADGAPGTQFRGSTGATWVNLG